MIELTNRFDFLKLKYSQRQKSTKSISRESTALFCSIVNHLEIDCRDHEVDSKAADYCKRVCTNFNLTYKDKVRQLYSDKPTIKKSDIHRVNLQKMILPLVDKEIAKQINLFIESELKKSR